MAIPTNDDDGIIDDRAIEFDVHRLEPGDQVDVFVESERRWSRGTFQMSTTGDALVELPYRQTLSFERALAMGLRRVLN
jgi:hypothetical protein